MYCFPLNLGKIICTYIFGRKITDLTPNFIEKLSHAINNRERYYFY